MQRILSIIACICKIPGITHACVMEEADRFALLDIELEAEKKAFMGLGKMCNSGIREVLRRPISVVAFTTMDFNWGFQANMLLVKDETIVGEEVRDDIRIKELKKCADVYFLHPNFIIYRDRVNFPADIVDKRCWFELPALRPDCCLPGLEEFGDYSFCFPSPCGDVFLKNRYYGAEDERGAGTVVFGFTAE